MCSSCISTSAFPYFVSLILLLSLNTNIRQKLMLANSCDLFFLLLFTVTAPFCPQSQIQAFHNFPFAFFFWFTATPPAFRSPLPLPARCCPLVAAPQALAQAIKEAKEQHPDMSVTRVVVHKETELTEEEDWLKSGNDNVGNNIISVNCWCNIWHS